MPDNAGQTITFKKANFTTHLPADYIYSPTHAWMARQADGTWRVGLTKFATRMLGELVDHGFGLEPGAAVNPGAIVGWIEGFKAISDLFAIAGGKFLGGNPALKEKITLVNTDPYGEGWLYRMEGQPDVKCVDVSGYCALLEETIERMLAQQERPADEQSGG